MAHMSPIAELLSQYRAVLVEMDSVRIDGQSREWNRLVDRMQKLHLELRQTAEGRAGITTLITDDNHTVRQWSATNALSWDTALARAELERQASGRGGLSAFGAKMVLREFDAGRLDTSWTPKS